MHYVKYYLQSSIIHRTSSSMSFFGIQVGLLDVRLKISYQEFLLHLTATRIEAVENMGNRDILTPTYGADRTNNPHIYWIDNPKPNS
jgi:hypothetical protein